MLKTLQLYTICIVVLVIVLSQFTLFSEQVSLNSKKSFNSSSKTTENDKKGFFEELKTTKYGEPLREIDGILSQITKSKKDLESSIDNMSNLLDIEKNINEMFSVLDDL